MRPDSKFAHRSQPKVDKSHLGRIDRGQPLYHGGIKPGDDSYDNPEFEKETGSLELKDQLKFSKGRKA